MGTMRCMANHDEVSFSDHIFNGKMQVREGSDIHYEVLFVDFESLDGPCARVSHVVRDMQRIEGCPISCCLRLTWK